MTTEQEQLLQSLRHSTSDGAPLLVEGRNKRVARELEEMGLAKFDGLYHGDHFWWACPTKDWQIPSC